VKILFAMASAEYLRYYDSTIRLLASRGHDVVIAVNFDRGDKKPVKLEGMVGDVDRVTIFGVLPAAEPWWGRVARGIRGTMDFVRYLDPRFADARALRMRIHRKVLPPALHGLDRIRSLGVRGTRVAVRALASLERAIPTVQALDRMLAELAPDAIVVSPLVDAASAQVDLVKSAHRLGIPVAAGIASWDNLTNKGLLRVHPDLVLVWNEIQKHEAVSLHGIAPERVAVTGAQLFDRWFGRAPSRDAEAFRRHIGLARNAPYVLFTGSSGFISEGRAEVAFVRRWVTALRTSGDPLVSSLPIVIRPHPYNARAWGEADVSDFTDVVVWPRGAYHPVAEDSRNDFFDSLYHSAAVVGINTSAMIEAAIVGRPVLSIHTDDFASTQEGTLHFHYLLPENGGFLRVAASLEEHVRQLAHVIANGDAVRAETDRFVNRFVRPLGRERDATPIVADTLERLAALRKRSRGAGAAVMLRPVVASLAAVAAMQDSPRRDSWHRLRKSARMRWHRARKAVARASHSADVGR
jgi:hypothetical protein